MSSEKIKEYRARSLAIVRERAAKGLPPLTFPRHAAKEPVAENPAARRRQGPCARLGPPTGEVVTCPSCGGGRVQLKVFACAAHAEGCTIARKADGKACCRGCPDYEAPADSAAPQL